MYHIIKNIEAILALDQQPSDVFVVVSDVAFD